MLTKRGIAVLNSTFSLGVLASFGFDPLFTTIALIVVTVLAIETMLYARSLRALRRTTASRKLSAETAFVGDSISVDLEIENGSRASLGPIVVKDGTPHGFKTIIPNQDWIVSIDGRSSHLLYYEIEPQQIGDWNFESVEVTLTDRFGIFKVVRDVSCKSLIKVYPSMKKGEELLKGRIHLGMRPIRRSAITTPQGSEFSGIREYYPTDDVRAIAWKAMARSPAHEPKTKQHENEQAINTVFVIGNSAKSGEGFVGDRKLDRLVETAIVLAYLSLKTGGSFHVVYSRNGRIESASGRPLTLAARLYNIEPDPHANIEALITYGAKLTSSRSLVLAAVDSPFPEKIERSAYKGTLASNHFLHVLVIETASFFPIESSDKTLALARDVIAAREIEHLRRLIAAWAEDGITAQICNRQDILAKAIEVFTNAGVMIQA